LAIARREQLDELIADGIDPGGSGVHASRARQLVDRRSRERLALEIEAIIETAAMVPAGARQLPPSLIDLRLAEIRAAQPRLRALAQALRDPYPPTARGVALTTLLIHHGRSPLYVDHAPDDVALAAEATIAALSGQALPPSALPRWWG
jgi:hypothetical protein